jgi:hypothetical protein
MKMPNAAFLNVWSKNKLIPKLYGSKNIINHSFWQKIWNKPVKEFRFFEMHKSCVAEKSTKNNFKN